MPVNYMTATVFFQAQEKNSRPSQYGKQAAVEKRSVVGY